MVNRAVSAFGVFALVVLISASMWLANRPARSLAQEAPSTRQQRDRQQADERTPEERAAMREERERKLLERFPEADTDKDGSLSQDEFRAFRESQAGQRQRGNADRQREGNQRSARRNASRPDPTHADVAYGDHERNIVDLYLVEADAPTPLVIYIHGGGFTKGSKGQVSSSLIKAMHEAGISVGSISYRYATTQPLPGPMLDGARAVQFLRANAETYNLDKTRFALTGGSAGAGISLWIAMHDDMADPDSDDPIARESTRVSCATVSGGQVSYDPRFWIKLGLGKGLNHSAFPTILGYEDGTSWDEPGLVANAEASAPINFLSKDDPPMRLNYGVRLEVTDDTSIGDLVHHPLHGVTLQQAAEPLGVICEVYYPPNRGDDSPHDFLIHHLKK